MNSQRAQYTNFPFYENSPAFKVKKVENNLIQDLNLLSTFESIFRIDLVISIFAYIFQDANVP